MKKAIWINKHNPSVCVEFVAFCEIRIAETKKQGVIYSRDAKFYVRSAAEFCHKFEPREK